MTLGDRLKIILAECEIRQVDFAAALGVSANYINQLVNDKKDTISETLAKLIEETYGYNQHWLLTGEGEKNSATSFSAVKFEFIKKIEKMPDDEVEALLAFANSLTTVKKLFSRYPKK